MQKVNVDFLISQASRDPREPIRHAIGTAIEVGIVVPSLLRARLESAGFGLVEDTASLAEYGFASLATLQRVIISDKAGVIVAMGAAGDRDEALLAAVLGWCRENPLEGAEVPAGVAVAPSSPTG